MGIKAKAVKFVADTVKKRGRRTKRGRPKKTPTNTTTTKQPSSTGSKGYSKKNTIPKLKGESEAAYKKRRAKINALIREQKKDKEGELSTDAPDTRDPYSRSQTIPGKRKDMSKATVRRKVVTDQIKIDPITGEVINIGKHAEPAENVMEKLYGIARKLKSQELEEIEAMGKKKGGPIGTGAALRGFGAVRKS